MTPFVFYYAASNFIAGLICLLLGIYVISKSRSPLNCVFLLLTSSLAVAGLSEGLMGLADSPEAAHFWHIFETISWSMVFALYLHFSIIFSRKEIRQIFLVYLISTIMILLYYLTPYFLVGYEPHYFGYNYVTGPLNFIYTLYYLTYMFVGLYLIYDVCKTGKEFYRRRQAFIVLIGSFIPIIVGTFFNQILPMLKLPTLPLAIHATAGFICLIGYALARYQIIADVSKEQIAEAAAGALLDPMFLVDTEGRINYANPAALRLTGFREDELVGRLLEKMMVEKQKGISHLLTKKGHPLEVDLKSFPLARGRGRIVFARDISQILRLRESAQRINDELKILIAREQVTMARLFEISQIRDPQKLKELRTKMQLGDSSISIILKPFVESIHDYVLLLEETKKSKEELESKAREIEDLNRYMYGRESVLNELENEYRRLAA